MCHGNSFINLHFIDELFAWQAIALEIGYSGEQL